jgi:hypothetical protein
MSTAPTMASPVLYSIEFTVDTAANYTYGNWRAPSVYDNGGVFSERPERGDNYFALIGFDDSLLENDGNLYQVDLNYFRLEIAGIVWDPNDPTSQFWGFRGLGLGSKSPVLQIQDHELNRIFGDVYGRGDYPFADFWPDNSFSSVDIGYNVIKGQIQTAVRIPSVPEPNEFVLWFLGIGILVTVGCFKNSSMETAKHSMEI